MLRSSVLYYPYVGLADSPWLKNALVFWDKIHVVVPEGLKLDELGLGRHYEINKLLLDEGVLKLVPVSSDAPAVVEAGRKFVANLKQNPSAKRILAGKQRTETSKIYRQKLPSFDYHAMKSIWHAGSPNVFKKLNEDGGTLIDLPTVLTTSYMNLLANELAKAKKISLGTDDEFRDQSLWSDVTASRFGDNAGRKIQSPEEADGFIVHLMLQTINVEQNEIKKILGFREKYKSERRLFRNAVQNVFSKIPEDGYEWDLKEYFYRTWSNNIEPKLDNLKKAVKGKKLVTTLSLLKAAAYCTPASLFGLSQMGPLGAAIGATTGVLPIVVEAVNHKVSIEDKLRDNPMGYVLRMYDAKGRSTRHDIRLGLPRPK